MANKQIIGTLTGRFKLSRKGDKTMSGEGTVVVRQEMYRNEEGFIRNRYYATLYGEFYPEQDSLLYTVIKDAEFSDMGKFYTIYMVKGQQVIEQIGEGVLCEAEGDVILRVEFSGKVEYLVKNKFGRKGKIFAMGVQK